MALLATPYVKFGKKGVIISRSATGGDSAREEPDDFISTPYWVKLVRLGSQLTGLISADKTNWKRVATVDIPMSETVYIGLAADASKTIDDINKYNTVTIQRCGTSYVSRRFSDASTGTSGSGRAK